MIDYYYGQKKLKDNQNQIGSKKNNHNNNKIINFLKRKINQNKNPKIKIRQKKTRF